MMKLRNISRLTLLLITFAFGAVALSACDQEGPLEKAGEKADEAVPDTKRAVKDAAD